MVFLKGIRESAGLSKTAMAKKLKIGVTHYNRLESTAKGGPYRTLCRIRKSSGLDWGKFGRLLDAEFGE